MACPAPSLTGTYRAPAAPSGSVRETAPEPTDEDDLDLAEPITFAEIVERAREYSDTASELTALRTRLSESEAREQALREKADAYDRINTPEIADFLAAVKNEALHQRERWGVEDDGGKEPSDWFWLVGYLAGKALHDVKGKRLHHIITTAAALLNWHGHETGHYAAMRPGISPRASTAPAKDANGS